MIAEIITIGNEILQGRIDDTNATHISRRLGAVGIENKYRTTIGDTPEHIKSALGTAAARADLIIVTGGLGPTVDDVTIESVAEFFGMPLESNPEAEERVHKFYKMIGVPCTENALRQARTIVGAELIPNPVGTALGAKIAYNNKLFLIFPGVPREMTAMLDSAIEGTLAGAEKRTIRAKSLRVFGVGESVVENMLPAEITTASNPSFSFLPQRFEVELRLTARGADEEECAALLSRTAEKIRGFVGEHIYGEDDDTLESVVFERLRKRGLKTAFAESCTGGMLGGRFTAVPGASEVFLGSVVTYTNEMKTKLLGVPAEILEQFGPVSEQTAKAMAERVMERLGADIGVSVTGNAGPTSGDEKSDVGQVYIGLAIKGGETTFLSRKIMRRRNDVRDIAVAAALDLMRKTL